MQVSNLTSQLGQQQQLGRQINSWHAAAAAAIGWQPIPTLFI